MKSIKRSYQYLSAGMLILSIHASVSMTVRAAPGDLDPKFGTDGNGKVIDGHENGALDAVVIQPDGKIVVAGGAGYYSAPTVARFTPDGWPDNTFGDADGHVYVSCNDYAHHIDIAVQTDGKIIGACYDTQVGYGNLIFRLDGNSGGLDGTFGDNGYVAPQIEPWSVVIQPDGKIIYTGSRVCRLNSDGSNDTSFGIGGCASLPQINFSESLIQSDGKIVAAGFIFNDYSDYDFAVARFNPNGSLDTTFDTDGIVTTDLGGLDSARSVNLQADGKILAAGECHNGNANLALVRYNHNGTLDTTFDTDGRVLATIGGNPSSIAFQTDGRILVATAIDYGADRGPDFSLHRFNPSGLPDTTFGDGNGIVSVDFFNGSDDHANAIALDGRGRAVVVGSSAGAFALARFQLDSLASIMVTNTNDSGAGSLRQAIADSLSGGTINFDPSVFATSRAINLTSGQLVIDKNLAIQGPGASVLSISGNNASRVFYIKYVNTGILTVALDGLTIRDGFGDRGFDTDSNIEYGGGGIFNGGNLTVRNSTINGNTAVGVNGNDGGLGGGIYNLVTLSVNDTIISNNNANGYGGGIYNLGTLTVSSSAVSDNTASVGDLGKGGGIYNFSGLTVSNSIISGNTADTYGGGIYGQGPLTVSNSTVSSNIAPYGGGLYTSYSAILSNSSISSNSGIGIYNFLGTVSVDNSTVSGNTSDGIGSFASVNCSDPEISHNATVYLTNATISRNAGAGVVNDVLYSDVCNYPHYAHAYLVNSIVYGNTVEIQNAGTIETASHNLIGDAASSGGITNGANGNIVGVNPLLGPLQDNGGPTLTHELLPGSPAINAGDNCVLVENGCGNGNPALPTDQRGLPRNGTVDIGAFERQGQEASSKAPFDFDGDGKTDISVYRPSDGNWYVLNSGVSSPPYSVANWGNSTDIPAPADYDDDGKTDVAVYRPSTGQWFIVNSKDSSFTIANWGTVGDKPAPHDFDGDGKADISVYRPSNGTWYIFRSNGSGWDIVQWGNETDIPVPGRYDPDDKTDIAVYRPSTGQWFIAPSTGGGYAANWGVAGDKPVPADYDGDGKDDIAVYRPSDGNWYIYRRNGSGYDVINWGVSNDTPVPGDYDGDTKNDIAQYRPLTGQWFILKSGGGYDVTNWGISTDKPLPASYIP